MKNFSTRKPIKERTTGNPKDGIAKKAAKQNKKNMKKTTKKMG